MDSQPWLDQLASELRRRGLPPAYIARYIAELNDHITDLIEERRCAMSKDALRNETSGNQVAENDAADWAQVAARIGEPATLAAAASAEFARRSFFGRHPIATFLVAPLPLAVLAWAATFAGMYACMSGAAAVLEWFGVDTELGDTVASWPTAAVVATPLLVWLGVLAPPAALTALLCRLGRRSGLSWRWSLAGCLAVAIIAGMFQVVLEHPVTAGEGRLMFGFGFWSSPPLQQWLQFALPLTLGLGLVWRQTHERAGDPDAPTDAVPMNRQAA